MDNNLESKLKELKKGYLKKLETLLPSFMDMLEATDKIDLTELYSKVHTISGTSGMYGLKELSDISNEFEIHLKGVKDNKGLVDEQELKERLNPYIESIKKAILNGD